MYSMQYVSLNNKKKSVNLLKKLKLKLIFWSDIQIYADINLQFIPIIHTPDFFFSFISFIISY